MNMSLSPPVSLEQPLSLSLLPCQLQRVKASVTRQAATQVGGEERGGGGERGERGGKEGDRDPARTIGAVPEAAQPQREGEEG